MGWLITVSGLDGAGKSTLIDSLTQRFEASGKEITFIRIRLGFTPLLERLKSLAGIEPSPAPQPSSPAQPKKSFSKRIVWHLYRLASLLDLIGLFVWISLLRGAGKNVIADRFHWDNLIIYQEKYGEPGWLGRGLWAIARLAAGKPDASFLLLIPAEESYRRVLNRNLGEAEESPEVLHRRSLLYANLHQPGLVRIDAEAPPDEIFQAVWDQVEKKIPQ